ncbi:MAG: DUF1989 domain-containing protein, partial [Bryobacteraceae bacterium]|nr:DUF1989 domain-containing protein [Bryobacteraceae bacterium]
MSAKRIVESNLDPARAIRCDVVPAGDGWGGELKAGQYFRIVDLNGNQAADTLFYNAWDLSDRYSAQRTIREQGGIYLTTGTKLLTERGSVLLTIV